METRFEDLNVVAIFFWGRAGSVFVHSLFDSHPDVLTIPATRLNAFHGRQWAEIAQAPSLEAMARRFVAWNPSVFDGRLDRWFEGLGAMGPRRDVPLMVDSEAFVAELARQLSGPVPVTRRRFFIAAHVAYALARGEDVSRKTTLVYHLHSPEAYAGIEAALDDFPNLRAVGVTREPVRSVLSYLRKNVIVARAWGQPERSDYCQLAPTGGFNFVYRHQLIGWRELLARFELPFWPMTIEALNRDTEGEMRALASFVGLRWDPCLTRSTFNGLEYHGDQLAIGQNVAATLAPPTSEESDAALDALDRYVLCGLLANFRREFGYGETPLAQRALAPLLLLLPTQLERRALRAELARGWPVQRRLDGVRTTLSQMFARQRYSYRHLLCEALPLLRSVLPPPEPLSPGLRLPPNVDAPRVGSRRSLHPAPESVPEDAEAPPRERRQSA